MIRMTLTANAAHELSRTAEKRLHEEIHAEAIHLVEGYISRSIKRACDKGAIGVNFKIPKEDELIWNQVRIILCNNGYKASFEQNDSILAVRW